MTLRAFSIQLGLTAASILVSLIFVALLVALVGQDPAEVLQLLWQGAFKDMRTLSGVVNFWIPLLLVCTGLVVTFRAGLWNIGIEGQMMMGAIFASGIALFPPDWPSPILIALELLAAAAGGMLWALVVGFLKTRLGVHEIFSGTAFNALANLTAIYLISSAWTPPQGGSAQSTALFPEPARLPALSPEFAVNAFVLVLAVIATIAVIFALTATRWGLQLKATGKNSRSALLLGVPVERSMWTAFAVCGALAGLAGAYRVLFTYNSLRPLVSGNIGFLGLLVVLLAGTSPYWVPFIAFIFAAILSGTTLVKLRLQLDTSLADVLQATMVLISLFLNGLRERFRKDG